MADRDEERARKMLNEWNAWAAAQPMPKHAAAIAELVEGENAEFVAMIAKAFAQVRAETLDAAADAVRALSAGHETTDRNIGEEIGLCRAEEAIRALGKAVK